MERYDFIRLYLHADVLLKTHYDTTHIFEPTRAEIASILVAAVWDRGMQGIIDLKAAPVPHLNFGSSDPSDEWSGVYGAVSMELDEIIAYYDQLLPSLYGGGLTSPPLKELDFLCRVQQCADLEAEHPWQQWLYPWKLWGALKADAENSYKVTPVDGCCVDAFHEYQSGTEDEWAKANNFKKIRESDGVFGCDLVSTFQNGNADGSGYTTGAFYSAIYGQIFNGTLNVHPATGSNNAYDLSGYTRMQIGIGLSQGPVGNGKSWNSPGDNQDSGFNNSWQLADGLGWYGEVFQANIIQWAADAESDGLTATGVININATIGENLDPFTMAAGDETAAATAAFKEMYELAVTEAGGFIMDPAELSSRLNQNPILFWGHSDVDIRTLPGTIAGSPLYALKMYAAPIHVEKRSAGQYEEDV